MNIKNTIKLHQIVSNWDMECHLYYIIWITLSNILGLGCHKFEGIYEFVTFLPVTDK